MKAPQKVFLSHSPATKSKISGYWYKSIKNQIGIGGRIVANVFGDSKEQAEELAEIFVSAFNEKKTAR